MFDKDSGQTDDTTDASDEPIEEAGGPIVTPAPGGSMLPGMAANATTAGGGDEGGIESDVDASKPWDESLDPQERDRLDELPEHERDTPRT